MTGNELQKGGELCPVYRDDVYGLDDYAFMRDRWAMGDMSLLQARSIRECKEWNRVREAALKLVGEGKKRRGLLIGGRVFPRVYVVECNSSGIKLHAMRFRRAKRIELVGMPVQFGMKSDQVWVCTRFEPDAGVGGRVVFAALSDLKGCLGGDG